MIFLSVAIARDNFGSRLNRLAGATLFFAGLGPLFIGVSGVLGVAIFAEMRSGGSMLTRFQSIWELFFPCLILFSLSYPVDRYRNIRYPRLWYLLFLPAIAHVIITGFLDEIVGVMASLAAYSSDGGFASILTQPLSKLAAWLLILVSYIGTHSPKIFAFINIFFASTAWYLFESGKRFVTNPRLAAQMTFILWSIRIGLGIYIIAVIGWLLLPETITPNIKTTMTLIATFAGASIFMYATIRYQFLDLSLIFRQSFVSAIASASLVGGYILLAFQAKNLLRPIAGERADIASYVLIILALLVFQPINAWLDNLIRAMFIRTRTDHRNVLEKFSRQVITIFDQRQLRAVIEETLKTTLLVEQVYFVLFDDTVSEYAVQPSEDFDKRVVLERTDLMLRGINLLDSPTYYSSLTEYSQGSALSTLLDERKAKLIMPLKDSKNLLGFLALSDKIGSYRFSSDDLNLLGVLSNQMVAALNSVRLYADSLERLRLQEEVSMARQIQLGLLPAAPPKHDRFRVSVHSTPSRTVGGDFYDFIRLPDDRWGMVIADASGKGMPAALMIAQIQAMIRSEVNNGNSISAMMRNMNQLLVQSSSTEAYVTLFYGELQGERFVFNYSNAGHNYPLLIRKNGDVEPLKTGGPIIGALPNMEYTAESVVLEPEDMLLFFTDGLSEAMNEQEVEYGEQRVQDFVHLHRECDPDTLINKLITDVRSYDPTEPPRDDRTIIALKINSL